MEHMAHVVFLERRPFSFIDFLPQFEVNGKVYTVEYGTLRNKFLMLRKKGEIELDYRTNQAFYTLKGHKFGKHNLMTHNHMGVQFHRNSDPIYDLIHNLPVGNKALHDIRLRLKVRGIWSVLATNSALKIDAISKDIRLPYLNIKGIVIKTTIHRTDTVSVVVACSYRPVAVDVGGIIKLSNALTRLEDRLTRLIDQYDDQVQIQADSASIMNDENPVVPDHGSWIVTMWHFGGDSITEYTSDKFCVTWNVGENALVRAYTKDMKEKGTRIRLERQEYPNKNFADAIEEKLNASTRMDAK
jgi:hypothetical protein